jgi:hypothetical protein
VSAPQLGQFGGVDGKNRGVRTLAQTLQVNVGRASEVMLMFVAEVRGLGTKDSGYFAIVVKINIPRIWLGRKTRQSDDIASKCDDLTGTGKNTQFPDGKCVPAWCPLQFWVGRNR